jgi:hypothetical protein
VGTNAEIVRIKDGVARLIHISYDGYMGGVGRDLFLYYDTQEKVDELFSHRTAATSLEANPADMMWSDWDKSYEGMPVADYIADQRRTVMSFATRPSDPANTVRFLEAIVAANPALKADFTPPQPYTRGVLRAELPIGTINAETDVRALPEEAKALLPGIVRDLFGDNGEPYHWEHAYGDLSSIADHFATPTDYDFDKAWADDEGVLDFVWANGKWANPCNVGDLTRFLETGESPRLITRELLMDPEEGNCSEEELSPERAKEPPRPWNEQEGIFSIDAEGIAYLTQDNGETWSLAPGPGLVVEDDPAHYDGKRVRVMFGNMMTSFSSSSNFGGKSEHSAVAEITRLELVDA